MLELPSYVLACPATVTLILRAMAGELPRSDYFDAWEALDNPDGYQPSEEVRIWVQANWTALAPAQNELSDAQNPAIPADLALAPAPELTRPWMQPFLEEYAKCGVIIEAAKAGPVDRDTIRVYRKHDPEFARAFALAWEEYRDLIRSTIKARGIDGWEEPVFGRVGKDQDGIVGHIRKHDNRVLMRLAESCLEEFASTAGGSKVTVNATASASANAAAMAVSAPTKLKGLQERKRRQLEKAAHRSQILKN